MPDYRLFIVDDEESIRQGIAVALKRTYEVKTFEDGQSVLAALAGETPDLVLLDIGLPDINGVEVLRQIKAHNPAIIVIVVTAYEDVDTVVNAMKAGAYDYIVKPIYMDGLKNTILNALETIRLTKEVQALQQKFLEDNMPFFVGQSNAIQNVMDFIDKVAQSPDTPILIQGETGTGKELIASAIHFRSPNFKGPFVPVNCAAIPRELIESELFGYEKGAFTGADQKGKKGLIESAADGTLFLDEIGDLGLEAQAKLLRFLEEREFYRVGSTKPIKVNTRLVSATNRDLATMIGEKSFREDLYFRLSVVKVEVPSLRERTDDIRPLAEYFLAEFSGKFNRTVSGFTPEAMQFLSRHPWPGNIRELRNLVERAVLIGTGNEIGLADISAGPLPTGGHAMAGDQEQSLSIPEEGLNIESLMADFERQYIEQALGMTGGNESKAARLLGLNHHTFRYRKKKHGI